MHAVGVGCGVRVCFCFSAEVLVQLSEKLAEVSDICFFILAASTIVEVGSPLNYCILACFQLKLFHSILSIFSPYS